MCGYEGPIYMTHPTKAICPILLVSVQFESPAPPHWLCAGRLPEDYCREEGGAELLHISDDQGLHEEGGDSQPPPVSQGTVPCVG